jgi:hypothetical protein
VKVRAWFVSEVDLPAELVTDIKAEIKRCAPHVDPRPLLATVRSIIGHETAAESEPTMAHVRQYAADICERAMQLNELIQEMPPAVRESLENEAGAPLCNEFEMLEDHLLSLWRRCYPTAARPARRGAPPRASRWTWIARQLCNGLEQIGIKPATGTSNPYEAILAAIVRTLEPQRVEPDVHRPALRALRDHRARVQKIGEK